MFTIYDRIGYGTGCVTYKILLILCHFVRVVFQFHILYLTFRVQLAFSVIYFNIFILLLGWVLGFGVGFSGFTLKTLKSLYSRWEAYKTLKVMELKTLQFWGIWKILEYWWLYDINISLLTGGILDNWNPGNLEFHPNGPLRPLNVALKTLNFSM